ncbi:MAG: Serine/threonine-protein kinase HipA [Labilithrix sp.]|nr:Serine/threonine-protein kinase HipA [Labilithrix sp.]
MSSRKKPDSAVVLRGSEVAGRITRTAKGSVFEYDRAFREAEHEPWEHGIAYRLPYANPRVETLGTNVHPFFAGLLPEGIRLGALLRRTKTSADDLLTLLVASAADPVGDVAVVRDPAVRDDVTPAVDVAAIETVRFADILKESLAGTRGAEPIVPGVQEKVSAAMISLPIRGKSPSAKRGGAYILKLNPEKLPRLVENERFFMAMGDASGLEVARTQLVHDRDGASGLLVERFDRVPGAGTGVRKIHQEDACQWLDRYPADKYVLSYADIARGITELASAPIVEMAKFVRLIAFSYLATNGDLHAKNVSLRTTVEDGRVELTPAYDLLSTLPYGDRTMALQLDGRDDNIKRAQVVAFGERHGVRPAATHAILDELCDVAATFIGKVDEIGLEPRKTADLRRVMTKRRADLGPTPKSKR